jgi:hypothetical protein
LRIRRKLTLLPEFIAWHHREETSSPVGSKVCTFFPASAHSC